MTQNQVPNFRVWSQGRSYVESSEILLEHNCIQPAAILAALAIEIFIKSFLANRLLTGHAMAEFGHSLPSLYSKVCPDIRTKLIACSADINPDVNIDARLQEYDGIFTKGRYWYEPSAPSSFSSDIVYFSRHLSDVIYSYGYKYEGVIRG